MTSTITEKTTNDSSKNGLCNKERLHKLSDDQLLRVRSIGILYAYDRQYKNIAKKIEDIAIDRKIDYDQASIVYVIGALKRRKKLGIARNYDQAIEQMETEQVGDRGCPLTRTIGAEKTDNNIKRINKINEGIKIDNLLYDYDVIYNGASVVNDRVVYNYKETDILPHFTPIEKNTNKVPYSRTGKVYGSLYAQWQEQINSYAMGNYNEDIINKNLQLFFSDYVSRLSNTSKNSLYKIIISKYNSSYIASLECANNKKKVVRSLYYRFRGLYDKFKYKNSITGKEFIDLLRQYIRIPDKLVECEETIKDDQWHLGLAPII